MEIFATRKLTLLSLSFHQMATSGDGRIKQNSTSATDRDLGGHNILSRVILGARDAIRGLVIDLAVRRGIFQSRRIHTLQTNIAILTYRVALSGHV